jgi:hypothetical protein
MSNFLATTWPEKLFGCLSAGGCFKSGKRPLRGHDLRSGLRGCKRLLLGLLDGIVKHGFRFQLGNPLFLGFRLKLDQFRMQGCNSLYRLVIFRRIV